MNPAGTSAHIGDADLVHSSIEARRSLNAVTEGDVAIACRGNGACGRVSGWFLFAVEIKYGLVGVG